MKIIIILIGLVLLSGCNKSDWFGYTSFNHCMVESMRHQPKETTAFAIQHCRELFSAPSEVTSTPAALKIRDDFRAGLISRETANRLLEALE